MKIFLLILLIFVIGCTKEVIIEHNNTIEVIKECPSLSCPTIPDCICNNDKEEVKPCPILDNSQLTKCRIQVGFLVNEMETYKNLTYQYISNETVNELENNLTSCIDKVDKLKELLK